MLEPRPLLLVDVVGLTPSLLGENTPHINALLGRGRMACMQPVFPAVTTTVQSSMLTGLPPSGHGIVGNGWYFRDQAEVRFWLQPNALVQGEKVWEVLARELPGFRCSQLFWWYNMYADVGASITPAPTTPPTGARNSASTHPPTACTRRSNGASAPSPSSTSGGRPPASVPAAG